MLWVKRTVSMRQFFLAPQNICLHWRVREYLHFYAENFCLSKPVVRNNLLHEIFIKSFNSFLASGDFCCLLMNVLIWIQSDVVITYNVPEKKILIYVRISFPLYIWRTNGWNLTNFCIYIWQYIGWDCYPIVFYLFVTRAWESSGLIRISWLSTGIWFI